MRDKRILACLLVGLAGCVSLKRSPEARFFVLVSTATAPADAPPGGIVALLPPRVPGYLDRPQMVAWLPSGELEVSEFSRWAEPVASGIQRVVAEDLAKLLPAHRILVRPWPGSARPACRIAIDISDLGLQKTGRVRLTGRYALLPPREEIPLHADTFDLERTVDGKERATKEAAVSAQSALLGELSARVAAAIREHTGEQAGVAGPNGE